MEQGRAVLETLVVLVAASVALVLIAEGPRLPSAALLVLGGVALAPVGPE